MFDKTPTQPVQPITQHPDLTGHPIIDKPSAVESGRLQPMNSPPPPPSVGEAPRPPVGTPPPAQLAGPVLAPAQSQKVKWIILAVVLVALLGVLGVWVYTLNRPSNDGEELVSASPEVAAPTPVSDGDEDKDGLMDSRERELGTDPSNPDSDADGLTDNEEVTLWNTDPLVNDTDKDGYLDGQEVDSGYNPNGEGKLFNVNDINL